MVLKRKENLIKEEKLRKDLRKDLKKGLRKGLRKAKEDKLFL